ncbi:MAG: (5-formylfuran-3-yl)methyl phosphate synthase, partial [Thermoguttaceae bacterium]|nr:(5-formylfuran-3-yl)methyl phosphate synthase [Thermoguttaceae bacterium]
DVLAGLPAGVQPMAVLYADWLAAAAPPPGEVLVAGRANGCRAAIVDTFDKSRGNLMDWFTLHELASVVAGIRAGGMLVVLAGSLSVDTIPEALSVEPDWIGVRGAACSGGRCGPLDPIRVRQLTRLMESTSMIESLRIP